MNSILIMFLGVCRAKYLCHVWQWRKIPKISHTTKKIWFLFKILLIDSQKNNNYYGSAVAAQVLSKQIATHIHLVNCYKTKQELTVSMNSTAVSPILIRLIPQGTVDNNLGPTNPLIEWPLSGRPNYAWYWVAPV